ncbi:CPBP family intramembrane metalloprotease [Mycobacteroides chelonae]|uniref:CPBP family intramembrane glutamic endopeptidase n=1 Tax=Mycobacteroides chelonae TaxID=1774 RepID=UPI001911121C|nr:type II CAAX endopeptidase family protein [Mycobacteroides chelonae]QQG97630.1 CPBP family intramembrane metalloprotease [Mycobacteroides chelonae]
MGAVEDFSVASGSARPGWLELGVAAVTAVFLYLLCGVAAYFVAEDFPIVLGQVNFLISGLAPLGAFAAAVLVRIRDVRPFGLRHTSLLWLLTGVVIGLVCFGLSWPVSAIFDPLFPGSEGVQQPYRDAAQSGAVSLIVAVGLGGVLTPLGEEALFRGVLATFLFRWGSCISVVFSAAVFAVAHGINAVMPLALMIGLANGVLLWRSGSIWPAVMVHIAYNSAGILYHGLGY